MIKILKTNSRLLLLFALLLYGSTITAQDNENGGGFNWDGMNELDNVNVPGHSGDSGNWDYAYDYNWDNYGNDSTPHVDNPDNEHYYNGGGNNSNTGGSSGGPSNPNRQKASNIVLTKKVKPGQTHTQAVKVLRDSNNSSNKAVSNLVINGVVVGTITFSDPQKDANGVEIYTKLTVEVFHNSPIAISSLTPQEAETSHYEGSPHSTNGNLQNIIADLKMYSDLGIVTFNVPINENEDLIITGSSTAAKDSPSDKRDPCVVAKELTTLGTNPTYQKAITDIKAAVAIDGMEHGITLGKNTSGQIIASTLAQGTKTSVTVNYNIQGLFACIHNHPNYTTHSGIDLYNITYLNKRYPGYNGSFVINLEGEVYTAVVTDLAAAQAFSAKYLTDPKTNNGTHYPEFMVREMTKVWNNMKDYSIESEARAKAFIFSKYDSGITFFKQNNGVFYPLIMKETKQTNGTKTYTLVPCS